MHIPRRMRKQRNQRVSNLTEVDLRVVIDRDVDLFLGLGRTTIICRRSVAWDCLDGLLDQLVALILQSLFVAIFPGIDTTTKVVVLRWWGGRPVAS